jgi:hypothetical protein
MEKLLVLANSGKVRLLVFKALPDPIRRPPER